jgi:hypothetical protein
LIRHRFRFRKEELKRWCHFTDVKRK